MKFIEFENEAKTLVQAAISACGYPETDVDVSIPPNPSFGELSSSVAMRLAKPAGEKPSDVARKLVVKALQLRHDEKYVKSLDAHPSGYINFQIDLARFAFDTLQECSDSSFRAQAMVGEGKRALVEHTSVNPSKAMHIGHARNLVLGDSLVRVLRRCGYDVRALNYIDDSGAQVADVIVGFRYLDIPDQPPAGVKYDNYCGDQVYVKVTKLYETQPELKKKQSIVLREIEEGRGELAEYASGVVQRILSSQLITCWRLGASYDLLNWESQIVKSGMWNEVFGEMKKSGITSFETEGENKGCWVISEPDTGQQKVLVRSDGTAVYVAKDIPYAAWKIGLVGDPFGYERRQDSQPDGRTLFSTTLGGTRDHESFAGADLAITLIDSKQSYLQRIVTRVLEGMKQGSGKRYLHRGYEVVALSQKTATSLGIEGDAEVVHMSGRRGLFVNVDGMLDALKKKAAEETRKRNPEEDEAWVDNVSEGIAVAALRYELLKQDTDKMIVFDIEESLRFEGDTGPYLQYTYARARRILDRSDSKPEITSEGVSKLTQRTEKRLVIKMAMLDIALKSAEEYFSPKEVAKYAHEVAASFNEFYEKVPVNREEDSELKSARLALVNAFSVVMSQSMELIGVKVCERI
ncbi:MAG TPA: arginine--tRNA ligase [Nitrososphaerales archaeon]|nr:arginine--tRNA ligase [Nitrososphaerales archaeon]